ncbi:hypothetical protein RISK_000099 [Rhodopirellula islandica]|uniref:Uncharacterized protein n=1 Tax=Rhodopirellula islandica TaxID=595434 RepID=A0A0J1BN90_RHOIS|nr:hypothetical protein RISK_000099 [Rhodopirellula islandica]
MFFGFRDSLFPGSAWEHTVLEAPPPDCVSAGGACSALRSQAEPGNEKKPRL